jgi:hypothetical protein
MVAARKRPTHRVRQASGHTRPALGPLAEFWTSFDPTEPEPAIVDIRFRSAPWDDIINEETPTEEDTLATPQDSEDEQQLDSPTGNLIQPRQQPTWYRPAAVPTLLPVSELRQHST